MHLVTLINGDMGRFNESPWLGKFEETSEGNDLGIENSILDGFRVGDKVSSTVWSIDGSRLWLLDRHDDGGREASKLRIKVGIVDGVWLGIFVNLVSQTIEVDNEGLYERNGRVLDVGKIYGIRLEEIVRIAVGTIDFCCRLGLFNKVDIDEYEVVKFNGDKYSLSREVVLGIDIKSNGKGVLRALDLQKAS